MSKRRTTRTTKTGRTSGRSGRARRAGGAKRTAHADRTGEAGPQTGIVVQPSTLDFAAVFSGDLTPRRLKSIMQTAAAGEPAEQIELFDHMLEMDDHIRCESNKRFMALSGLRREIVINPELADSDYDEKLALEILDYCRVTWRRLDGREEALRHLGEAVGTGVMCAETVWDTLAGEYGPVALLPVPARRLHLDPSEPWRMRIIVGDDDHLGNLLDEEAPGKFILYVAKALGGNGFRGGLYRASLLWFMFKKHGYRFFMKALELFGQPFRTATYPPNAPPDVRTEILKMLMQMATSAAGVFPQGTEFNIHESALTGSSKWPQQAAIELFNSAISKIWLGSTGTTEITSTGGNRAWSQTSERVLDYLLNHDISGETGMLSAGFFRPLVRWKFGDDAVGLTPVFRAVVDVKEDPDAVIKRASVAVNELGARVPASVITSVGIPLVADADPAEELPGRQASVSPFPALAANADEHGDGCVCGCHPRNTPARRRCHTRHSALADASATSPLNLFRSWMSQAVAAGSEHTRKALTVAAAFMERGGDLSQIIADLPALFAQLPVEDLAEVERSYLVAAQLAGRATLRRQASGMMPMGEEAISRQPSAVIRKRRRDGGATGATQTAHAEGQIDFAQIPFEEAIRMLRQRVRIKPDAFEALDAAARSRAWRVAGVWNMDLLSEVHDQLLQSIKAGETARDFRLRLPDMADRNGWSGENPWHGTIVQFQNFAMAHAAGRAAEYREFAVPNWRFVVWDESTACPICGPLAGKIFDANDRTYWPPMHFNCRCMDEPVFEGEAQDEEVSDSADIDAPAIDQEQTRPGGFKWDVGQYAQLEPIDLSKYPADLRAEFEAFAKTQGWEVV